MVQRLSLAPASCFQRIIDNYSALLQEWIVYLDQKLQAYVRGRVIGCEAQMNTFDFFFGLNLGERLFSHTDNLSRFEIGTGAPSYPTTPQDHYRRVYFEAIDLMVNAIDLRFNQASYRVYEKMESFLVKCLNCQDYSTELRYLETNYKDDVNVGTLNAQLEIFKLLMKEGEFTCLDDIQAKMKTFSEAEKEYDK